MQCSGRMCSVQTDLSAKPCTLFSDALHPARLNKLSQVAFNKKVTSAQSYNIKDTI